MKFQVSRSWSQRSLDARRTLFVYWRLGKELSLTVPIPWGGKLRKKLGL
jgi:hypothetical protein